MFSLYVHCVCIALFSFFQDIADRILPNVQMILKPIMGEADFSKARRGTSITKNDMRTVYGGKEVEAFYPDGGLLFRLFPASLSDSSRKRLEDSFKRAALLGESNRKNVLREEGGVPRGSLLAGAYDGRDMNANQELRKRARRSVPVKTTGVCRTTPFSLKNPKKWEAAMPAINQIANLHKIADPEGWEAQTEFANRVLKEYRIGDSSYTTLTANYNANTTIHNDVGNFAECTTAMAVVGRDYSGGELCFPRFRVAVKLSPGDVIFFSGKEFHGNAPISGKGFRLSALLYARRGLEKCTKIIDPRNNLGVAWKPTPHDKRFLQFLKALVKYQTRTGKLPPVGATEGSLKIGEWARARRRQWADGNLSKERADLLESVPGWQWEQPESSLESARNTKKTQEQDRFNLTIASLKAYVARYSHLPRPGEYVWNIMLNKWVDNRRQDVKRGTTFSSDMIALLGTPRAIKRVGEDFQIAIPTFKRESEIKSMTLNLILKNKIDPSFVTLFVADKAQAEAYSQSLIGEFQVFASRIVVAAPGIRAARNAIRTHFEPGTHVVSIDDDVRDVLAVRKGRFAKADLRDIVRDGALACDVNKAKLWGVYPVKNTLFMRDRPFAGLAFIQGQLFGCFVDRDPTMKLSLEIKEDHENTLKHFSRDGVVARLDYAIADSVMWGDGGIQATSLRDIEKNEKAAKALKAKYPGLVTLFVRKTTGMTEIRYISSTPTRPRT